MLRSSVPIHNSVVFPQTKEFESTTPQRTRSAFSTKQRNGSEIEARSDGGASRQPHASIHRSRRVPSVTSVSGEAAVLCSPPPTALPRATKFTSLGERCRVEKGNFGFACEGREGFSESDVPPINIFRPLIEFETGAPK